MLIKILYNETKLLVKFFYFFIIHILNEDMATKTTSHVNTRSGANVNSGTTKQ